MLPITKHCLLTFASGPLPCLQPRNGGGPGTKVLVQFHLPLLLLAKLAQRAQVVVPGRLADYTYTVTVGHVI